MKIVKNLISSMAIWALLTLIIYLFGSMHECNFNTCFWNETVKQVVIYSSAVIGFILAVITFCSLQNVKL